MVKILILLPLLCGCVAYVKDPVWEISVKKKNEVIKVESNSYPIVVSNTSVIVFEENGVKWMMLIDKNDITSIQQKIQR